MKNTIIYDLASQSLDCISVVNNGNSIELEFRNDIILAPFIIFTLNDGSVVSTDPLEVKDKTVSYTIPEAYYNLTGSVSFKIKDTDYESETFTLAGVSFSNGANLMITASTDTTYICSAKVPTPEGGTFDDEWRAAINANTAARHSHDNKTVLDNIKTALTNMELEQLLSEEV